MRKSIQNKGFTLLEILLVIAAIGILAAIVLVAINPNRQIEAARNAKRRADINTIQKALEQYLIDNGRYPTGVDNTYKEICNTGSNSNNQGTVGSNCIDLREIVPDYLASIPVNPTVNTQSGYYAWINDINNKVAVLAGKGENGEVIGINHLKENIVTDGLVLHLDAGNTASYPGTGTTWFDLSGNGNNGTLINGVGFNSANGGSLVFDGVDDYVRVSSASYLNSLGSSEFTVYMWIYREINPPLGSGELLYQSSDLNNGLVFGMSGTGLRVENRDRESTDSTVNFVSNMFVGGVWNNIVLVKDTTTYSAYRQGIYVNQYTSYQNVSTTTNYIDIGRVSWWGPSNWEGGINQVFVYNRALNPEEIQQNFNATRGRFGL